MSVPDHLPIFKRIRRVLVVVGLLDNGYIAYCMVNGNFYSSSSLALFCWLTGEMGAQPELAALGTATLKPKSTRLAETKHAAAHLFTTR